MKQCQDVACDKSVHAKGYCSKHYSQLVRAGRLSTSWKHINRRNPAIIHAKNGAYKSWQHMKARCYDPRHPSYKYYGAAGVQVCQRWLDNFSNFLADMGERPDGFSLDRIEPYDDYEPDNCRWVDKHQQAINKKSKYRRKKFIANYSL
jgi:hypothetical protein